MKNAWKFSGILVLLLLSVACGGNKITIKGKFAGVKDQVITLERMNASSVVPVDSVKTNSSGDFSFTYKPIGNDPVFLRISHKEDFIILVARKGEVVELNSMLNLSNNYIVKGSEDSELIKELNAELARSFDVITALYDKYNKAVNDEERERISYRIGEAYVKQKQYNIRFIVTHPKSLASIIALYQTMPNGVSIFGDRKDYQYFKLVSDSLLAVYPEHDFVKGLSAVTKEFENRLTMSNMINETIINNNAQSYPEIALKDAMGTEHKLSELEGKVILLSFWSTVQKGSPLMNKEYKDLYEAFADKGLVIYQVSFDSNKTAWINEIKNQQLPWVSVYDPAGLNSPLFRSYSIQFLPANYIIDRKGDIVGKNLWGAELTSKLNTLF